MLNIITTTDFESTALIQMWELDYDEEHLIPGERHG